MLQSNLELSDKFEFRTQLPEFKLLLKHKNVQNNNKNYIPIYIRVIKNKDL